MMEMLRKKIGSFYLVERIGSGGISEVYVAIDPGTRKKRVFKFMKMGTKLPLDYSRFLREVDIVRGLSHPGVIKIYDNSVLEDRYYYSMEYVPGGNLAQSLWRKKTDFTSAIKIFIHICTAIAHAHENGVIHGTLKPSNILLKSLDNPVISDFGIAKTIEVGKRTLTQAGEILGSIAYMAPEQRTTAMKANQRADVYALGAVFYEMLTGFPPLGQFPWPGEILPQFPSSLQSILGKCLAIEPRNRFRNAGFIIHEMKKFKEFEWIESKDVVGLDDRTAASVEPLDIRKGKIDRIVTWMTIMRNGTTRERLAVIREMTDTIKISEVNALLKLYSGENDRVRWGLIRVLGELKISNATPLILNDMQSTFHAECAIEALGKIGSPEAFKHILEYIETYPASASFALVPLALTGRERAIPYICRFLNHNLALLRDASMRALACIKSMESLQILKDQMCFESNEKVLSNLTQTVYSMESELLPHLNIPVQSDLAIDQERVL